MVQNASAPTTDDPPGQDNAPDPLTKVRSRAYLGLLAFAALAGVPIAAFAYWFLKLAANVQTWVYSDLPEAVGFTHPPTWWPIPPLVVAGIVVGLVVRYSPGHGGHSPADGFHTGGFATPVELPGIALAAVAGIGLGAVVGPEAPLIALGGGLAYLLIRLTRRNTAPAVDAVVAATGSFAAVSTLLGSPLIGAFLLMEASGLGGLTATAALLPGLLGAGVGALIFVGFGSWTGYGTFSLTIPDVPPAHVPTAAELGWALAVGLAAAPVCWAVRHLALTVRSLVTRRTVVLTPLVGLVVAGLAIGYAEIADRPASEVLFSGQNALPGLISHSASYSVGTLLLLLVCKALAYGFSLSSFRGGPIFPAMFLGAAGGVALSHVPGLDLAAAAGTGIGAMTAGMLQLPMTAVLLATLFLGSDGITVLPLVIVAVVVSYVTSVHLAKFPAPGPGRESRS